MINLFNQSLQDRAAYDAANDAYQEYEDDEPACEHCGHYDDDIEYRKRVSKHLCDDCYAEWKAENE